MGIARAEIDYSSKILAQAEARYHYQCAYVAAMSAEVDPKLAQQERDLLYALCNKVAGLRASHAFLAAHRQNGDVGSGTTRPSPNG